MKESKKKEGGIITKEENKKNRNMGYRKNRNRSKKRKTISQKNNIKIKKMKL
jgi:hypothetical protein